MPLVNPLFPRSSRYNPDWLSSSASGGANPLWLTEWLASELPLRPGIRVLDLGCGRAASSIFLSREFKLQVWAADLWFDPSENLQRIRDAGLEHSVFPLRTDARSLPFADAFFDAILSIDSFVYYGTDDLYLNYLARFVKPGGRIAIAGSGLTRELEGPPPDHLRDWWTPELACLHSADWWRRHWERTGIVDIQVADTMPEGWRRWLDWIHAVAPANTAEMQALEADRGEYLGYIRLIGTRTPNAQLSEPILSVPSNYVEHPLLAPEIP